MKIWKSTDAGMPTFTGQADSLNNLLAALLPEVGWTSPFYDSGSRTRVFRSANPPYAFLQVKDGGSGLGSYREARLRGYEAMSDALTGTGPFPTTTQRANGWFARKSATLDATARPWVLAADGDRFYFFPEPGDVANVVCPLWFGKPKSNKFGDAFNLMLVGRNTENSTGNTSSVDYAGVVTPTVASASHGSLARSYTGVGSAVYISFHTDSAKGNITTTVQAGSTGMPYPLQVDGGLYMAPLHFHEANAPRGDVPGLWCPLHNRPLAHKEPLSGIDNLTGRDFMALNTGAGQLLLETSDTWNV